MAESSPGAAARRLELDARGLRRPDIGTVDALARAALSARRRGRSLVVAHAPAELRRLLDLAGLKDVIACA